jgi:hypothetical protein
MTLKNDVNVPLFQIPIRIRIRTFLGLRDPVQDPLVRGTDLRIWIRTEMSRIPNKNTMKRKESTYITKYGFFSLGV